MSYVIAAWWTAKPGDEAEIVSIIEAMSARSLEEPGCLAYQAHRSLESPSNFFLYERYADEEAFRSHGASEHYRQLVQERALPLLEERRIDKYETLEDSGQPAAAEQSSVEQSSMEQRSATNRSIEGRARQLLEAPNFCHVASARSDGTIHGVFTGCCRGWTWRMISWSSTRPRDGIGRRTCAATRALR